MTEAERVTTADDPEGAASTARTGIATPARATAVPEQGKETGN
jgi:hypothetical protein